MATLPPGRGRLAALLLYMSAPSVRFRRSAFTLLELLVVIAVLGILALILIPVVAKIRASAQSTHCTSNLQQLGRAFTLYAQDHRSMLPPPVNGSNNTPWYVALHPYTGEPWRTDQGIGQLAKVFRCPTWELKDHVPAEGDIGYAMSAATGPTATSDPSRPPLLATLAHPTRTVILLELTGTGAPYFPATGDAMSAFAPTYLATYETDGCDRHAGAANYLFADGHVGHHTPEDAAGFLK